MNFDLPIFKESWLIVVSRLGHLQLYFLLCVRFWALNSSVLEITMIILMPEIFEDHVNSCR